MGGLLLQRLLLAGLSWGNTEPHSASTMVYLLRVGKSPGFFRAHRRPHHDRPAIPAPDTACQPHRPRPAPHSIPGALPRAQKVHCRACPTPPSLSASLRAEGSPRASPSDTVAEAINQRAGPMAAGVLRHLSTVIPAIFFDTVRPCPTRVNGTP